VAQEHSSMNEMSGFHNGECEDVLSFGMFRRVVWYKLADVSDAIALIMEAVSTSETSVSFSQTTRRNIPEDSHLQLRFGLDRR
jgi:hypothetical protein